MRIMLTGSEAGAIDTVSRGLAVAGHEIINVLELAHHALPVDPTGFDVALSVRAHPLATLTRHEACLHAALAAGTPLVLAGAIAAHPLLSHADEQVIDLDTAEIADAIERAVARCLLAAVRPIETNV